MASGAGKYNKECTIVRKRTEAMAVLLVIINGKKGHGFEVQCTPEYLKLIPSILRDMATEIEKGNV